VIFDVKPDALLAIVPVVGLILLGARISREAHFATNDHGPIFFGALLFAGLLYRLIDVLQHLDGPRWSAAVAGVTFLGFLHAVTRGAAKRRDRVYRGPERRLHNRHPSSPP